MCCVPKVSQVAAHLNSMAFDTAREPVLNFRLYPTHGAQADAHHGRESSFGLELVDHRASKAGDLADLGEPENLYGRCRNGGLDRHECDPKVWFR